MKEVKFRYRLELLEDSFGDFKKGDVGYFFIELSSLERYPIDERWKILSRDLFTGIKDKNGEEIYEGDIIDLMYSEFSGWQNEDETNLVVTGEVVFMPSKGFHFKMHKKYDSDNGEYLSFNKSEVRKHIIQSKSVKIGNIYENPELLK